MRRSATCILVAGALALGDCSYESSPRPVGSRCEDDQECEGSLLCAYGRCRPACHVDRDCPDGGVCVEDSTGGGVCSFSDETGCEDVLCAAGQVCVEGGECVLAPFVEGTCEDPFQGDRLGTVGETMSVIVDTSSATDDHDVDSCGGLADLVYRFEGLPADATGLRVSVVCDVDAWSGEVAVIVGPGCPPEGGSDAVLGCEHMRSYTHIEASEIHHVLFCRQFDLPPATLIVEVI